jgi:hypothetical protein
MDKKGRVTLLPQSLKQALSAHLTKVKALYCADMARCLG